MLHQGLQSQVKDTGSGRSLEVLRVEDPALTLLWLRSQLWLGFDSWPGNVHMP